MHFGNGDEEDHITISQFLDKCGITKYQLFIYPGLPYGCLQISNELYEVLEKNLDKTHKCVQLKFKQNSRYIFFLHTMLTPSDFTKSSAICDIPDSDQKLIPNATIHKIVPDKLSKIMEFVKGQSWVKVAFRRVQFYGNEHIEGSDYCKPSNKIPDVIEDLLNEMKEKVGIKFDTITVAEIGVGQGIPIAVESHIFDDVFYV